MDTFPCPEAVNHSNSINVSVSSKLESINQLLIYYLSIFDTSYHIYITFIYTICFVSESFLYTSVRFQSISTQLPVIYNSMILLINTFPLKIFNLTLNNKFSAQCIYLRYHTDITLHISYLTSLLYILSSVVVY